jgi:hypothetical protein
MIYPGNLGITKRPFIAKISAKFQILKFFSNPKFYVRASGLWQKSSVSPIRKEVSAKPRLP